jgi:filamentous hemagglutinin
VFRLLARENQRALLEAVLFAEMTAGGREAAAPGPQNGDFTRAFTALTTYFPGSNPDVDAGETNPYAGDISLFFSRIYTLAGGTVSLLAPGGGVNVGLAAPPAAFGLDKPPAELGLVVQSVGNVNALVFGDFQVNESRTFAADGGNILVWSTRGDIDAGRGAKNAISAPPPTVTIDSNGRTVTVLPAALTGSGIQTIASTAGREPGDVDLFAPRGVVDAGDAGIVAGNLTIAATAVLGANNIQVSGTSVGVPVDAGGLGASLAAVSSTGSSVSASATDSIASSAQERKPSTSPLADAALGFLDVFLEGFGPEVCRPNDQECLERTKRE